MYCVVTTTYTLGMQRLLSKKLSAGFTELPQDNYGNLLDGWRYDRSATLHKYISNLFADKTSGLIRELFDGDEELVERARQEFRTAIDQYGRFARGVSPKLRQKAAFFRQHFFDNYVDPARQSGQNGFTIKTLDVIRDLNVIHDKVNVSETALKAKFKKDANVVYDGEEPKPADELILKFRFLDRAEEEISSPSLNEKTKTMRPPSLNQVFDGLPRTGKTNRTSQEAVRICDGGVSEDRTVYMERYNTLMEQGRNVRTRTRIAPIDVTKSREECAEQIQNFAQYYLNGDHLSINYLPNVA